VSIGGRLAALRDFVKGDFEYAFLCGAVCIVCRRGACGKPLEHEDSWHLSTGKCRHIWSDERAESRPEPEGREK
jgi:hypothetical protein